MIIHRHDELASTNDEALHLAQEGAPGGTVVQARQQTAGRGRQGRTWFSPAGNLYASFLLRPGLPPDRMGEIGFVMALAVAETIDMFVPGSRLKWPNDVLLGGAKIAGILTECRDAAVVVGIGVNVTDAPTGLAYPATSLAAHQVVTTVDTVLTALVAAVERQLGVWAPKDFGSILRAWQHRGPALGQSLRVQVGAETIEGCFAGLATDGGLLLSTAAGVRRIVAGDVS